MKLGSKALMALVAGAAISLSFQPAAAQPKDSPKPKQESKPTKAKTDKPAHIGDPYPLDTCPISGKKLGSMGDPIVKVYDGREVRFCCDACPPKFEKDLAKNLAKIDAKIIADQGSLYPLKTSLVTGKDLPAKPYEFVYGNRLIRLGAESEKAEFLKDPKKHFDELNKAVIAAQSKDYPLKTCLVSKEALGGDMGEPIDIVLAGRLIKACCKDCKKDIEKEPAKFIAAVDEARKPGTDKGDKAKDTKRGG